MVHEPRCLRLDEMKGLIDGLGQVLAGLGRHLKRCQ